MGQKMEGNIMKEIAKTIGVCALCYGLAWLTVQALWPHISAASFMQSMPAWLPAAAATVASLAVLFLITHMERGCIHPESYLFLFLYGAVCLGFSFSTALPGQFNVGTATVNMAFVYVVLWKLLQKKCAEKPAE